MSKAAGVLVFLVGIGGLGAWASVNHAKDIEAQIAAGATASTQSLGSGVTTVVSGRDIELTGEVGSEAQVVDAVAAAQTITGVREVRSTLNVAALAQVSPFVTTITKAPDGTYAAEGAVSPDIEITDLAGGALEALQVAGGAPDGYNAALSGGIAALAAMDRGTLRIEDTAVSLSGEAADAASGDAVTAALADLPDTLNVTNDVDFLPVADPFTFDVEKGEDGQLTATGFLPADVDLEAFSTETGVDISGVTVAAGAADGFAASAMAGIAALSDMQSGNLSISDTSMTLTGDAADQAQIASIAATPLPEGFDLVSDVSFTPMPDVFAIRVSRDTQGETTATGFVSDDDQLAFLREVSGVEVDDLVVANGAPDRWDDALRAGVLGLNDLDSGVLILEGSALSLRGSAPDEETFDAISDRLNALQGDVVVRTSIIFPVTDILPPTIIPYSLTVNKGTNGTIVASGYAPSQADVDQLQLDGLAVGAGAPEGWVDASERGLAALAELTNGSLLMEGTTLRVVGAVPDRESEAAVTEALSGIVGFDVVSEIEVPEIAPDLAMTARFEQNTGMTVSGIAPEGLTSVAVADFLGAATVTGDLVATSAADLTEVQTPLAALQPHLDAVETMTVTWRDGLTGVSGVLIAQADLDAITSDIESSGAFDAIDLTLAAQVNSEGDTRVNPVTGINETYSDGVWSPQTVLEEVVLNLDECQAQTSAILAGNSVNFLTGGAQLDETSRGVISDLATTIAACFEANSRLTIMIEGHTDNTGSAVNNIRLSNARADAVRDALLSNGVSPFRIQSIGFGQERPIADNNTQEGRAQNRRTVLVWNR